MTQLRAFFLVSFLIIAGMPVLLMTSLSPMQLAAAQTEYTLQQGPFQGIVEERPTGSEFVASDNLSLSYDMELNTSLYWERQGVMIPAGAPGSWKEGGVGENTVLYDDGIYKMWFSGGWGPPPAMGYATSNDGITWIEYAGNPVLASYLRSYVMKVGSEFWMYATDVGQDNFDLFTSSDGISWSSHASNPMLSNGTGGDWDASDIANKVVWEEDGSWYMMYDGNGPAGVWQIGLATSNDGLIWTKDAANNPVISFPGMVGGPQVIKFGSTYYMWLHSTAVSGNLPTDIRRMSSTDLITWTDSPGFTLWRNGTLEGENTAVGQIGDPHLIEIGGQTHLYYSGLPNGTQPDLNNSIYLAIAPYSLAELVSLGGLLDYGGSGYVGEFLGGISDTGGVIGRAIQLDDYDDFIRIDGLSDFVLDQDFTISMWIRPHSVSSRQYYFSDEGNIASPNLGLIRLDFRGDTTGFLEFLLRPNTGGSPYNSTSTTALVSDVWYHVAFGRTGSNIFIRVNNTEEDSDSATSASLQNENKAVIGTQAGTYVIYGDLDVDEFLVFSRVPSETEFDYLYNHTTYAFRFNSTAPGDVTTGLSWVRGGGLAMGAAVNSSSTHFTLNITQWVTGNISWDSYANQSAIEVVYNFTVSPSTTHTLRADGVLVSSYASDANGDLSFSWLNWTSTGFSLTSFQVEAYTWLLTYGSNWVALLVGAGIMMLIFYSFWASVKKRKGQRQKGKIWRYMPRKFR